MKNLKSMTFRYKGVVTFLYQVINYAMWYFVQSLPVLYQKGYQEFLESIDIQMVDRKKYYKNMHSLLGRMPFEELMKQNPYFVYKNIWKNPFKDSILWANETGLEYDYYQKNILCKFVDPKGGLNEEKLRKNYNKLAPRYIENIKSMCEESLNEKEFINSVEDNELLEYFSKSYKIYTNDDYCIIVNRVIDDKHKFPFNDLMLIDSYSYSDDYHIDTYKEKPVVKAERIYIALNYPKPFNKANFAYACADNSSLFSEKLDEFLEGTILSKEYIVESLAKINDEQLLKKLCLKSFTFIESVENRAVKHQVVDKFTKRIIKVTQEEIEMYKKEMNNENSNN